MKKTIFTTFILTLFVLTSKSQNNNSYQIFSNQVKDTAIVSSFSYFLNGTEFKINKNPIIIYEKDLDSLKRKYSSDKNTILYAGNSLNHLFSKKLSANFKTSNDLTLQKAYFNIDPTDKSLSLGYNFDNRRGNPLEQLNWVLSLGAKIASSDGFAVLPFDADSDKSTLGFNFKISLVNNGRITWIKNGKLAQQRIEKFLDSTEKTELDADSIIKIHRNFLYHTYNEKVKKFNETELKRFVALTEETNQDPTTIKNKIENKIDSKSKELLYEMIKEEINYVESNKLYSSIYNSWTTFELYLPFGNRTYNITPITSNNEATNVSFYPMQFNTSWNFYYQKSEKFSLFGKFSGSYKNNNNIDVDGLKEKEFQSIVDNNGVLTLTNPVKAVELMQYNRFKTTSLKAELAFFFLDNKIGFSPSIEKNFGDFKGVNWKLGIPFSLKDKEGKQTVNFEFQWKETETFMGSIHLLGISTSFFFGDLIN